MEIKPLLLVMIDISGYTQFIQHRKVAILHAESIISALLESVIENAEHPLTLNKLEGDAALLYAHYQKGEEQAAVEDVLKQVMTFFDTFNDTHRALFDQLEGGCPCDACTHIHQLKLKSFIVMDENIVVKQLRGFTELAGEAVILIHRMMKNSIKQDEYLLVEDRAWQYVSEPNRPTHQQHHEEYDLGKFQLWLHYPNYVPIQKSQRHLFTNLKSVLAIPVITIKALHHRLFGKKRFINLTRT